MHFARSLVTENVACKEKGTVRKGISAKIKPEAIAKILLNVVQKVASTKEELRMQRQKSWHIKQIDILLLARSPTLVPAGGHITASSLPLETEENAFKRDVNQ